MAELIDKDCAANSRKERAFALKTEQYREKNIVPRSTLSSSEIAPPAHKPIDKVVGANNTTAASRAKQSSYRRAKGASVSRSRSLRATNAAERQVCVVQRMGTPTRNRNGELRVHSNEEMDAVKMMPCSEVACTNPNCCYLVHENECFEGYCCRRCHWRHSAGAQSGKMHGYLCQKRWAPAMARASMRSTQAGAIV